MAKKILIISSSPRRGGNSDTLCDQFMRGAADAGHSVQKVFLRDKKVNYCLGCGLCTTGKPCPQKDDAAGIIAAMLEADVIVMGTPVYFYSMSAQLKTLIDRFCAFNSSIQSRHMKSALLSAAWNSDNWTFEALEAHYQTLVRYLNLQDMGTVWGKGCGSPSMTKHSQYPQQAYELGRNLK